MGKLQNQGSTRCIFHLSKYRTGTLEYANHFSWFSVRLPAIVSVFFLLWQKTLHSYFILKTL